MTSTFNAHQIWSDNVTDSPDQFVDATTDRFSIPAIVKAWIAYYATDYTAAGVDLDDLEDAMVEVLEEELTRARHAAYASIAHLPTVGGAFRHAIANTITTSPGADRRTIAIGIVSDYLETVGEVDDAQHARLCDDMIGVVEKISLEGHWPMVRECLKAGGPNAEACWPTIERCIARWFLQY